MTIRVVVADDHDLLREGLVAALDRAAGIETVGAASSGGACVDLVERLRPDVVVMDLRMPGGDGIAATRRIMAGAADPPAVVVLTTFDDDELVFGSLRAGASAFILKSADTAELVRAIRAVHVGDVVLAPAVTRRVVRSALEGVTATRAELPALTEREHDVLVLIAAGLSNERISARLHISVPTVKTHVRSLFHKTGATTRVQLVIEAFRAGLAR